MNERRRISCSSPAFFGREREFLLDCIGSGWITQGKYVRRAEDQIAALCGCEYAVACSSGTTALHLAMIGLGLQPHDVVIVPAMTYAATAHAVVHAGGVPMFCDVYRDTWCINPASAGARARQAREAGLNVAGVIPVHLYGMPADLNRLRAEPGLEGAWLLEDAAEAFGAGLFAEVRGLEFDAGRAGGCADAGALSFYGNKIITAGEGGAVLTNSERIARRATLYRGQGARTPGIYEHDVIGFNYRMTDLQAAVLCGQLETVQEHHRRRRRLARRYRELLVDHELEGLELQLRSIPGLYVDPVEWLMPVLLPPALERDQVAADLDRRGVETRPFFTPLPLDVAHRTGEPADCYPVSVELHRRGLCLPLHAGLEEADVDFVCEQLLEAIR